MENGFLTRNQGLDMTEKITGFVKSRTYDRDAIDGLLDEKQDVLNFDNTPTENSTNPVTSGGVYNAISKPDLYEVNIFYDFTLDKLKNPTEYTQSGYAVYKNGEDITNTITNFKTFVDNLNNTNNILKFYSVKSSSVDTPRNHRELLRNYKSSTNFVTVFNVYNSDVVGTIRFKTDEIACTFRESTIDVVDRIVEDTYGCNVRIVLDVTDIPHIDIDLDNIMFANVEDYVQTIKYTKYKINKTSYTYDTEVTYTDSIIKFINNVLPSLNAHYNLSITVDIIKSTGESSEESRECYAEYINHKVNNAGYYDNYLKLYHDFRASGAGYIYDYPQNAMQYVGLIVVPSVEYPEATSYCKFARVVDTELTENSNNYITSGTMFDIVGNYYTKTETDNLLNDKQDTLTFDTVPTDESENPVTSDGIYNDIHINIAEDSTYESVKTLSNCGAFPMLSLTAEINAVQEPAGGGKNKLPMTVDGIKASNTTGTWSGDTYSINGGTFTVSTDDSGNVTDITVNGTFNAQTEFRLTNPSNLDNSFYGYILNGSPAYPNSNISLLVTYIEDKRWKGDQYSYNGADTTINQSFPTIIFSILVISGTSVTDKVFKPMLRLATETDPTFAPYSNICPISGWDEVKVTRCGKNLFDGEILDGYYDESGFVSSSNWKAGNLIKCYPDTNYIASFSGTVLENGNVFFYDKNKNYISYTPFGQVPSFKTPNNSEYFGFYLNTTNMPLLQQIELGNTATAYEPYKGKTYTIDLDGTRYGGTLDVVSGELSVTHGEVDLGDLNWMYDPTSWLGANFYAELNNIKYIGDYATTTYPILCEKYKVAARNLDSFVDDSITVDGSVGQPTHIQVKDSTYTDAIAFKTAVTGTKLVYELATPLTIQLAPTQVKLLLGTNNIWANSGDVGDARYIVKNAASDIITAIKDICYTKTEIDTMIGDISNALDTINGEVV